MGGHDEPTEDDVVRGWIGDHALPLATDSPVPGPDLEPLRGIVDGARVVGLGASALAHELQVQQGRVIRFLVQELGFRVLALEDAWTSIAALERDLDSRDADPAALLVCHAWQPWHTVEVLELLSWVRSFNRNHPTDPVRVVGVDVARATDLKPAAVIECVRRSAPARLVEAQEHYAFVAAGPYDSHDSDVPTALRGARAAHELVASLPETAERASVLQHAWSVVGHVRFWASRQLAVAEEHLADNVAWWTRSGSKVIYWGGLAHTARADRREIPSLPEIDRSVGGLLRERFAASYLPPIYSTCGPRPPIRSGRGERHPPAYGCWALATGPQTTKPTA